MNPEIEKVITEKILSLPQKVQDIIRSIDTSAEISNMRQKHQLMLDQVSNLEMETIFVMIGLEQAEDFVDNLIENLKIDEEKAIAIANDINTSIFDKIRKAMMETINRDDDLDRETILKEIENPVPTSKTIVENPPQKDSLPEIPPAYTIQKYANVEPIAKNVIEKKLTEPTHIQTKETEVSLKKIPQINSIDPYKEPIN